MLNNAKYLHYSNKMPTFVARNWGNYILRRKKIINF